MADTSDDHAVVLLIDFFRDEYAENQKGVTYWFSENGKGSIGEFLAQIDRMKIERSPVKPSPEQQN